MTRRRYASFLLVVFLLTAACGELGSETSRGPLPECETPNRGRLVLMAQSVPSAGLVPCIIALPSGWEMTDADTSTGRSTLRFDNDTHDVDVVVRLQESCDASINRQISSDRPGTSLYIGGDGTGDQLAYSFETGCITFEFPSAAFAASADGRALLDAIDFLSRDRLRVLSNRVL